MGKNKTVLKVLLIFSTIIFFILLIHNHSYTYRYLPLLTASSVLVYAFSLCTIGRYELSISSLLIFGETFVRYCLLPLLMVYGNYNTIMKLNIDNNASTAIMLMIYENVIIYYSMALAYKKNRNVVDKVSTNISNGMSKYVYCLTLFCIAYICFNPSILNNYLTIFSIGNESFTMAGRLEEQAVGSIMRILHTLYSVFFNVVRILLPTFLIFQVSAKIKSNVSFIVIVLLLVFSQYLLITATFAESIVSSIVVFLAVYKVKPNVGRLIARSLIGIFMILLVVLVYCKYQASTDISSHSMYSGNNAIEYFCAWTNAYFTGLDNVAASMNMPSVDKAGYFFASMQITIPFNTTLFGKAGETLPVLYCKVNNVMGQIPSSIGNGYYYFGFLFAPIFSALFSYYSVRFNQLALSTSSYWKYVAYIFTAIVLALGIGMYNEVIALGWFNMWCLPLIILATLVEKRRG